MNSVKFVTVSGNVLYQLADRLLPFLVHRISGYLTGQNIKKYSNVINHKTEINQIDWTTLFDSHDMNLRFEKFLHILTCVFDGPAPIKKLLNKKWVTT